MFRHATHREVIALLQALGGGSAFDAHNARSEADLQQRNDFRHEVIERTQAELIARARFSILRDIRNPTTRKDIAIESRVPFTCDCGKNSTVLCPSCQTRAEDLTTGVFSVFERDMILMIMGKQGAVLAARPGIQFLLAGIVLGKFYQRLPPSQQMVGLTTRAIQAMLDPFIWTTALQVHGPAPMVDRTAPGMQGGQAVRSKR